MKFKLYVSDDKETLWLADEPTDLDADWFIEDAPSESPDEYARYMDGENLEAFRVFSRTEDGTYLEDGIEEFNDFSILCHLETDSDKIVTRYKMKLVTDATLNFLDNGDNYLAHIKLTEKQLDKGV